MISKLLLRIPAGLRPILETVARWEHRWPVLLLSFVSRTVVKSRRATHSLF
jgi:hypothetical protein